MKDVVKLDNPKGACSSHECETNGNSYKYQPNNYAVLEKSDFDNPKLKSIKASDIEAFVDPLRMKFSEIMRTGSTNHKTGSNLLKKLSRSSARSSK